VKLIAHCSVSKMLTQDCHRLHPHLPEEPAEQACGAVRYVANIDLVLCHPLLILTLCTSIFDIIALVL